MLGEITKALLEETKELLSGTGATVQFRTNWLAKKVPDNNGNLVLMDIQDGADSVQFPGGLTMTAYRFNFNSYNYQPDATVDDPTDFSTNLMNFIDDIRQHFSKSLPGALPISGDTNMWLTQAMTDIWNQYGFFLTFSGITGADPIDTEGLLFGFKISFESTALDSVTLFTENDIALQTITQINNPPQPIS